VSWLLDTNVLSESVRPQPDPHVVRWLAEIDEDAVHLSVIVLAEIRRGIELLPSGPRRDRLIAWLEKDLISRFDGRILDIDRSIAEGWGKLIAVAQKSGVALSPMDAFFGATALVYDLTLVTRDIGPFERLSVPVFNPWDYRPGRA
jgi:predicted nucleic acid-binding protein